MTKQKENPTTKTGTDLASALGAAAEDEFEHRVPTARFTPDEIRSRVARGTLRPTHAHAALKERKGGK